MSRLGTYQAVLGDLGVRLTAGCTLLDFGCGDGELVREALAAGIDAYGCDVELRAEAAAGGGTLPGAGGARLRLIDFSASGARQWAGASPDSGQGYRLPFPDASFDVVVSDQVFEHVRNYPEAIAEIRRVLKPGGAMLHLFPSSSMLFEPHLLVPLAIRFHPRWWLHLWARLGLRNSEQYGMSAAAVTAANAAFLATMVNYLPESRLRAEFSRGFRMRFAEREFMRHSRRARYFLVPWLYRRFWARCVFGIKV